MKNSDAEARLALVTNTPSSCPPRLEPPTPQRKLRRATASNSRLGHLQQIPFSQHWHHRLEAPPRRSESQRHWHHRIPRLPRRPGRRAPAAFHLGASRTEPVGNRPVAGIELYPRRAERGPAGKTIRAILSLTVRTLDGLMHLNVITMVVHHAKTRMRKPLWKSW